MKAKQVIPGAVGLPPQTTRIVRTRLFQSDILSYASFSRVVILSSQLVVLQIIEVGQESIRAIQWQPRSGNLAVACGKDIVVYGFAKSEVPLTESAHLLDFRMNRLFSFENDFAVESLAWEPVRGQYLLAGGSKLVLWELRQGFLSRMSKTTATATDTALIASQLQKLFGDREYRFVAALQADGASENERSIKTISFSPDGSLFASIGANDRCIKVWYHSSLTGFSFVYLPHGRAVAEFEWRLPHTNNDFAPNVLLSRLVDGSIQLWEETQANQRLQFSLKLTLNADPVTSAQWLFPPVYDLVDVIDQKSGRPASISNDLLSDRHAPHKSISDRHTSYSLSNNPTETQDWIVGIQADGSVLFWKVKGLGVPKQAPTATLYSVLKNVLSPSAKQDNYHQIVAIAQRFAHKNKIFHPSIVSLFAASGTKRDISAWSIELSTNRVATALARRSAGHVGNVVQLESHCSLPLAASVDISRRVLVWKVADTTFSDTAFILNDLCVMMCDEAPLIAWDLVDSVLYVFTPSRGIAAYYIPVLDSIETTTSSVSQHTPSTAAGAPIAASQPTPSLSAIAPHVQPILLGYLPGSASPDRALRQFGCLTPNSLDLLESRQSLIFAWLSGTHVSVWKVVKPELVDKSGMALATPDEPATATSLLDARRVLAENQSICSTCSSLSIELETAGPTSASRVSSCSLVTGCSDGYVRGWTFVKATEATWDFKELFCFRAAREPIVAVKSAFLGRIATRAKDSSTIEIWESESHAPNFLLEGSLRVRSDCSNATVAVASRANRVAAFKPVVVTRASSPKWGASNAPDSPGPGLPQTNSRIASRRDLSNEISFDWLCLVSGGQLLAVCADGRVQLWCLRRSSDLFSFKPQWSRVDANLESADSLELAGSSITWTSVGQLIVSRDDQLIAFSQWLESEKGTLPRLVEDENRALPVYHPKALVEYLMAGKLDRVHLILKHILSHFEAKSALRRSLLKQRYLSEKKRALIALHNPEDPSVQILDSEIEWNSDIENELEEQLAPSDPLCDMSSTAKADDACVPPLPLNIFPFVDTELDVEQPEPSPHPQPLPPTSSEPHFESHTPTTTISESKSDLFDDDPYENLSYDAWDKIGASSDEEAAEENFPTISAPTLAASDLKGAEYIQPFEWNFDTITSAEAKRLASRLGEVPLEGLNPHEQIYLMALLDTLSSLERSWVDMAAVRFALSVRYFLWMKKTNRLPPELRESGIANAPNHTLASVSWCWALHCHDQQQLVNLCVPPTDNTSCIWDTVRMFGIPLWCVDNSILRQLADRLSKQHFLINRDPSDCALFYIILGKKSALQTLYKTARDDKLATFLSNDFMQNRWREAALKNAYALLGKQRYQLAAAFFLLGGAVKDAITVCISNLNDWMLALFIARLVDGDGSDTVKEILQTQLMPKADQAGDLALLSICYWTLRDYKQALTCLVLSANSASAPTQTGREFNPGILHLFSFISKHPRVKLLEIKQIIDAQRRMLEGMAVFAYMRSGLSRLALQSDAVHFRLHKLKSLGSKETSAMDLSADIEAGLHRRALLQFITKEIETTRAQHSLDLSNLGEDIDYLAHTFSIAQQTLMSPLQQYCEARLFLKPNYLLIRMQDDKAAGRFLIRSAKRIIPICLSLVTYPLSEHHARAIHRFTLELYECICVHSATEGRQALVSSSPPSAGSTTAGVFSRQARSAMEASIRLGLFLAAWTVEDYDVLTAIIVELGGASWPSPGATRLQIVSPGSLEQLVAACGQLRRSSTFESGAETELSQETQVFLQRLFHLLLLFKFISLLEEFLAKNGFHQPGSLNMIRTLRHWLFTAESNLKDIPTQIVSDRFTEILHAKSKSVFNFAFFDFFARLADSFPTSNPCRMHLWDSFGHDEGVVAMYLQKADFLKQGMRFVRLVHELQGDFEEESQRMAGTRMSIDMERPDPSRSRRTDAADTPSATPAVKDILYDIDSRLRSPSPIPRTPSPSSITGDDKSDDDSVGSRDSDSTHQEGAGLLPVRPLAVRPSARRKAHSAAAIRFAEALVMFRDKDILQSFCINPTRSKQIAVATTHGISEIAITTDSLSESVIRRSSSDTDLLTASGPTSSLRDIRDGLSMTEDDKQDVANWIESHPTFPYYLSGSVDGSIRLWQFNVPQSLALYREKTVSRVSKLRFNWNGTKFAAADQQGSVQLWRFDASEDSVKSFATLPCHNKRSSDVVFLNSGSVIAAAGESTGNKNVSIWDTLMPAARSEVASFTCQIDGATSIVYSPRWQLLFAGGKQGSISVIDVRQRQIVQELDGHARAIKDMSIDPTQSWMISGSTEGNVKIWDLSTLSVVDTWEDAHTRQTFVRNSAVLGAGPISTHGVMQVKFTRNYCYTCGSDGRLVQRRFEVDM